MRSITIFLFFLTCFATTATANAEPQQGMQFFEGTWQELLDAAKKQGKLIFVDVYTDWCPPCKQMDKEIFPLKEVGDTYNSMFLNYRLDAEKGEGVAIAGKYSVKAYPTYLYLNAEGTLLHRAVGFQPVASLSAHAASAMSAGAGGNSAGALEKEFRSGKRAPEFLRGYLKRLAELELDNTTVLNAYVEAVPSARLASPEELAYLAENVSGARSNALVFLMDHYTSLPAEQKKKTAARVYSRALYNSAGQAWKEGRPLELRQIITYMETLAPELPVAHHGGISKMKMLYYGMVKDLAKLKETGYRIVGNTMNISLDSIRAEDARMYGQTMKPFLSGEQDSTKVPGFQEEKQFIINQYSRKISSPLYETAAAFAASLDAGDAALADALQWAERVKLLMPPSPAIDSLVNKLKTKAPPKN
ncbi:thioredoxin family protein [Chitinophaga sp. 22620]|uniref:thioredoxin family protein n=1 Tax=Chitinophaga sp. 22620 TaxID=3453952 RepID=UPI003F83B839